ncbi:MAG: hypothetical protein ACRERZ_01740, partial [Gammaproteobacteria bacterium]
FTHGVYPFIRAVLRNSCSMQVTRLTWSMRLDRAGMNLTGGEFAQNAAQTGAAGNVLTANERQ